MKNKLKKTCVLLLTIASSTYFIGCGNSSSSNSSTTATSYISGKVVIPNTNNNPKISLKASQSPQKTEASTKPLTGADITFHNAITDKRIEEITDCKTNDNGEFSCDTSNVSNTTDLENLIAKAIKTENSKKTLVQAYIPTNPNSDDLIEIDTGSTVIANTLKQTIYDKAGDLLGKSSTDLDTSNTQVNTIKTSLKDLFDELFKVKETLKSQAPPIEFNTASENIEILQQYENKKKVNTFLSTSDNSNELNQLKQFYESKKELIGTTAHTLSGKLTYPENLELPIVPEGFDTNENKIKLHEEMTFPKGTKFMRGVALHEDHHNKMPEGATLYEGFDLPLEAILEENSRMETGFTLEENYTKALPAGLEVHKDMTFPDGTTIPKGFTPDKEFIVKEIYEWHAEATLPPDCKWDEYNKALPNLEQQVGFEFEKDMILTNIEKYSNGIKFGDGLSINNDMRDKFADDFEFTNDMKDNLDTNFKFNENMMEKFHDTFKFNNNDKSYLDGSLKFKDEVQIVVENI